MNRDSGGAPAGQFALEEYLRRQAERVERALTDAVSRARRVVPDSVFEPLRYGVLGGGKRLRPILCMAAYEACGGARPAIDGLAVSLELIHAYSLMHDDLPCMDDAALRRGRDTAHRVYGEAPTIRAGAALIPLAAAEAYRAAAALECGPEGARDVVRELMEAAGAGGMVGGQWLDLLGEGRQLDGEALGDLHRRKTGALLRAALTMGARAAAAPEARVAALEVYGDAVGLAFQIADDVLDATQDADALGKHPSDAELEKSTYVSLYGLDGARARAEAEVARAVAALKEAALEAPALEAIARFIVERRR